MNLNLKHWLPDGELVILCSAAALALLVLTPAAHSACVGLGCDGPVREAYIICCNQLVYTPWKEGVGADRTIDCDDYLKYHASPEARQSICAQLKDKGLICPAAAASCNSPNGRYCGDNMPEKGGLFAMSTAGPIGRIYSKASTDSGIAMVVPNGTRLVYQRTTRINGQPWYYVQPPGRPAGWIPGSEVACTRPGTPVPPDALRYGPHIPYEGTAALTSAGRG